MIIPDFMDGKAAWPVPHRLWKLYKDDIHYRVVVIFGYHIHSQVKWAIWDYTYYQKMWMAAWPITKVNDS